MLYDPEVQAIADQPQEQTFQTGTQGGASCTLVPPTTGAAPKNSARIYLGTFLTARNPGLTGGDLVATGVDRPEPRPPQIWGDIQSLNAAFRTHPPSPAMRHPGPYAGPEY